MISKYFSLYDSKAGVFRRPFLCRSRGEALRGVMDEAAKDDTDLNKFASDYTLFEIGSWDDEKGTIIPLEVLENLGLISTLTSES